MFCPKCHSKTRVPNTRHNIEENETYRRHICTNKDCNNVFYTIEFEVIADKNFKKQYNAASKRRN